MALILQMHSFVHFGLFKLYAWILMEFNLRTYILVAFIFYHMQLRCVYLKKTHLSCYVLAVRVMAQGLCLLWKTVHVLC